MRKFQSASGTGLAFILFTEAVNQFPWGNVWALLFFLMLFTLGLDSQFGTLQGVIQCIIDLKMFPESVKKEIITGKADSGFESLAQGLVKNGKLVNRFTTGYFTILDFLTLKIGPN